MLKGKFNEYFSKKQQNQKEYRPDEQKPKVLYFNEAYFECKLIYNPHKLSLIKVKASISVGPDAGNPMIINCRWFVKSHNKFKEMVGVKASCYQPCIEDVGCQICVQIEPTVQGRTYSGKTITKQTRPIQLGSNLQSKFTQIKNRLYHFNHDQQYKIKIQNIKDQEEREYPFNAKLLVKRRHKNEQIFIIQLESETMTKEYAISQQYPAIQFIRNSYNTIIMTLCDGQQIRLSFEDTMERDLFGLLSKTLSATSIYIPELQMKAEEMSEDENEEYDRNSVDEESQEKQQKSQNQLKQEKKQEKRQEQQQKQRYKKQQKDQRQQGKESGKSNTNSKQNSTQKLECNEKQINTNTTLSVRNDQQFQALKNEVTKAKKESKQIRQKFNNEKKTRLKLQAIIENCNKDKKELQQLRMQRRDIKQKNEEYISDNRFYINELTILKKQLKEAKDTRDQYLKVVEQQHKQIHQYKKLQQRQTNVPIEKVEMLKKEIDQEKQAKSKVVEENEQLMMEIEKLQNELKKQKKKIQSLAQQKIKITQKIVNVQKTVQQPQINHKAVREKDKVIENLNFKIRSLQTLLNHRMSEPGNQNLSFQKIVSNLTETVTEKQYQLEEMKKINKELMQRLKNK